ncbi:hypothetical protein H0H81_001396 [Sphagnurus paluster]|uniref:Uncharacterized protein n=1 Tax=Sphagnurus paluster TaxID=117069 RepID=A0A9P7FPJ8_9AGAR|nr:hypothetical protein H0H81_001396 [Sphagnurus paluster]
MRFYLNKARKNDTQHNKLDTYVEFHNLAGHQDIPALPRLLRNSAWQGWGIKKTVRKAHKAVTREYHPHSYSDYEKDIAIVTYELGGSAALYALNHSTIALPSRKFGGIKMSNILANIETNFKDIGPNYYKTGISLCVDEMAIKRRLSYLLDTGDIAGLCHHSKALGSLKMGDDMNVVSGVAKAVRITKDVHGAHEVTVAAFSHHDPEHCGAQPALLLPTCKKGLDFYDAALELKMIMEGWKISEFGAELHGEIWSIASDGDGKHRKALYLLCIVWELKDTDPLFKHLGHLLGLNLFTRMNFETAAFNWKHNWKRGFFS